MSDEIEDAIDGADDPIIVEGSDLTPLEILVFRELMPHRSPKLMDCDVDDRVRHAVDMATIAINETICRVCRSMFQEGSPDAE